MPRRPSNPRIASFAAALAAGALAAFALRPASHPSATSTAPSPVAEVRTQVIRRTIHVVHHERPPRPRSGGAAVATAKGAPVHTAASGSHSVAVAGAAPRSRTSGATGAAPVQTGAAPVRTATSGSHSGSPSGGQGSGKVRTRSSGAGASPGGGSVRTRSSGAGHGDGGGHDD